MSETLVKRTPTHGYYCQDNSPTSATMTEAAGIINGTKTDNPASTYWTQYYQFGIDLGSAKDINRLRVYSSVYGQGDFNSSYDSLRVYKSSDNTNWTSVKSYDGDDLTLHQESDHCWWDLDFSTLNTRYIKVYSGSGIAFGAGGASAILSELEAYYRTASGSVTLFTDPSKIAADMAHFPMPVDIMQYCPEIISDLGDDDKLKLKVMATGKAFDADTKLLIRSDEVDGNVHFYDASPGNLDIGHSGSTVYHSDTKKKFGKTSMYFGDSSSYMSFTTDSTEGVFTGEFTIDFWINFNSIVEQTIIGSTSSTGWYIQYTGSAIRMISHYGTVVYHAWTPTAGTWYHIAYVRDSSDDVKLYIDGVLVETHNFTDDIGSSGATFDTKTASGTAFNGYIDEMRWSHTARWTSAFTPPTSMYGFTTVRELECYVAVGAWNGSDEGVLTVGIPCLSASDSLQLEISWDTTWAKNTDYVGYNGNSTAAKVFDNRFISFTYFARTSGGLRDETDARAGTLVNMSAANQVTGPLGMALTFDGTEEYVRNLSYIAQAMQPSTESTFTVLLAFKAAATGSGTSDTIFAIVGSTTLNNVRIVNGTNIDVYIGDVRTIAGTKAISSTFQVFTYTDSPDGGELFCDGVSVGTSTSHATWNNTYSNIASYGARYDNSSPSDYAAQTTAIMIVSKTVRSDDWIKTMTAAVLDQILGFPINQRMYLRTRAQIPNSFNILGGI